MIDRQPHAVGIVAAKAEDARALDRAGDQRDRQVVLLGKANVAGRRADRRRQDQPVGAQLQQRVDEGALLGEVVMVVAQDEGLALAVQLVLDGFQDLAEERVHDVVDADTDDARARGAQRGGAAIVDVAEFAGRAFDPFAGDLGHQRTVAQRQRDCRRRQAQRIGNRRKFDLLRHLRGLLPTPSRSMAQTGRHAKPADVVAGRNGCVSHRPRRRSWSRRAPGRHCRDWR